jgi:anti-sigma B factor antagonist
VNDQLPRIPVGDVQLAGDIDVATADTWRQRLLDAVRGCDGADVIVDMSAVTFIDASGVAILVGTQETAAAEGKRVVLHSTPARVMHVLDLVELTDRFAFDPPAGT